MFRNAVFRAKQCCAICALLIFGGAVRAQDILITGHSVLIPAGSVTTDKFAGTDMGQVLEGGGRQSPILVHNLDPTTPLNIGVISVSGPHSADFSVFTGGSTPIGGSPRPMSIQFTAGGSGVRSATINFNTNDPGTPNYSFAVRCEVLVSLAFAVPELEVQLIKGPKHNCDGNHDPCRVSGKIEVRNTQFLPLNAGTIRVFGTNAQFFDPGSTVLLAELPLKRIKAGKLRNVRFKANFSGPVPFARVFIRVESTDPSGVEASYGDNQVVGIVPIL